MENSRVQARLHVESDEKARKAMRSSVVVTGTYLSIHEHSLMLCLSRYLESNRASSSWHTPATTLVALVAIFPTTSFQDLLLTADTWRAIFILFTILDIVWLAKNLFALRTKKTLDDLVAEIKKLSSEKTKKINL